MAAILVAIETGFIGPQVVRLSLEEDLDKKVVYFKEESGRYP